MAQSKHNNPDEDAIKQLRLQPNIGNYLAEKLLNAEIYSIDHLRSIGSESAFIRLNSVDKSICINVLYALEGAVQGIRWHSLGKARKAELLDFYNQLKRSSEK